MVEPQSTRVAEDEHGKRATYEDLEIGKDLGSFEWIVSEEDVKKQYTIDDDHHDWFINNSPYGGAIAPPQITYRPPRWLLSRTYNVRGVSYKWGMENLKEIKPGMKILVTGCISNKWIKNDREFVQYDAEGRDEQGELVFKTYRVHVLDVIKRDVPREGKGIDSGVKNEKI